MLKIDASFGERKNGIRTQDLNTTQTLLATAEPTTGLSTEESNQVCIQQHRIKASADSSCLSLTQFLYCQRFPAGSAMPEWILSLPTTTASSKIISQRIVAHYTTGIKNFNKCIKVVAGGCSQFCVSRCIPTECSISNSQCAMIDKILFCLQDSPIYNTKNKFSYMSLTCTRKKTAQFRHIAITLVRRVQNTTLVTEGHRLRPTSFVELIQTTHFPCVLW